MLSVYQYKTYLFLFWSGSEFKIILKFTCTSTRTSKYIIFLLSRKETNDGILNRASCLPNGTIENCDDSQLYGGVHDISPCMSGRTYLTMCIAYFTVINCPSLVPGGVEGTSFMQNNYFRNLFYKKLKTRTVLIIF